MKNEKIRQSISTGASISDTHRFVADKASSFQRMIMDTIMAVQRYKTHDIIGGSDLNVCIQSLEGLYDELNRIQESLLIDPKKVDYDTLINRLQKINNELATMFRTFGTSRIDDLVSVAMGTDFLKTITADGDEELYRILRNHVHPISYKVMSWSDTPSNKKASLAKNRIVEDFMIVETARNFDCFDLARTSKNFHTKVYGIKVAIQNVSERKTLIVQGLIDDLVIQCTNYSYAQMKLVEIVKSRPSDPDFNSEDFKRFLSILTLKEILIYGKEELYQRFVGYMNQANLMKQKPIAQNVRDFLGCDLFGQRRVLIQLLMKNNDPEFQYLAYLLYDLLSNESNGSVDTLEQTVLFDSLPWSIKKFFRDAMKMTLKYTKNLSNFDNSRIPIEQQICLLKAPDKVKEKAMTKLKEVKAKSEDSGSKARQFLEGLLKIPFGIYRREPILDVMGEIKSSFKEVTNQIGCDSLGIPKREEYSSLEIVRYSKTIRQKHLPALKIKDRDRIVTMFCKGKRDILVANTCYINGIIRKNSLECCRLCHSGKKNGFMRASIKEFIHSVHDKPDIIRELYRRFPKTTIPATMQTIDKHLGVIESKWDQVNKSVVSVRQTLDEAVHGHRTAKRQVERIIGQWLNGEQSGYCFGFEGPPGVGKTSLARKGLAQCLKGADGSHRPFAFIAVGGSSNGSTLSGHNYTYVGSTWGRIVDIVMEKKCLNPIIFIDELDKVSRSEHGKEIIGILTHLVDAAQNESFQDNYFSGIDLDLSKALFIFSYNDPDMIDRILLDRIHRVKFDHLSLDDKIIIANKYLLPEIYDKVGLKDMVRFPDEVISFIVETYTYESGVRKLKEILFEIVSEINLEILSNSSSTKTIPITVTIDDVKGSYLRERTEIRHKRVHDSPRPGIINGLWASALGKGGIIPIETFMYPAQNFLDLKLTGMQGDVMKESMNVAKTLAWELTSEECRKNLLKTFNKTKLQGIHVHCPEGSTPKDGPSAGTAITVSIYSRLTNSKVKPYIAVTGEIDLQGQVTAIGGLDIKILGGIRAGVKEFIYPSENSREFDRFMERYGEKEKILATTFHPVSNIQEVLQIALVE